jgi:hypothetical protein
VRGDERDPGELLDHWLGENGLQFPRGFEAFTYRPRRRRSARYGFGVGMAAAALLLAAAYSRPETIPVQPAPAAFPAATLRNPWTRAGLVAQATLPAWTRPGTSPLQETSYRGHALINGVQASLVVTLNGRHGTSQALAFDGNEPLWYVEGTDPQPVAAAPLTGQASGYWVPGGSTSLTSFSAAGQDIYITHGDEWALLNGQMDVHWGLDPLPTAVQGQVAALPADPARVLLLTESVTGTEQLYLRAAVDAPWQADPLPASPITQLVALNHQFWALANGRLWVSNDGVHWVLRYRPPRGFTVATFAAGQNGGHVLLAASLGPAGQAGVGPTVLSTNDGGSWHDIGLPWPNGTAPTQMVVTPTGFVGALLPGPPALLEEWQGSAQGWRVIPLPETNGTAGTLTAFANGDLLYAGTQGALYRWVGATGSWIRLPAGPDGQVAPNLLMAIGNSQAVVSYPNGWWVLVLGPKP